MFEAFKEFLATRGVQLIARYIGMALFALATYLHITVATSDGGVAASTLASLIVGAVLMLVDHWSHAKQAVSLLLLALVLCSGCSTKKTSGTSNAEKQYDTLRKAEETNADLQFDAQEAALKKTRYHVIQLELDADIADTKGKGALDPNTWTPVKISAEITRLTDKAAQRRAEFDTVQAQNRALHQRNIDTNRAQADKIAAALNPPKIATTPVNLAPQIGTVSGTNSNPSTLLNP